MVDAPRSGRPRLYDDATRRDLLALATAEAPEPFAGWTHLLLAAAMGELNWWVSPSWVGRALKGLRMKVHRVRGWLHRREDPNFETRVAAVEGAIAAAGADPFPVLCLDEKTAYPVRTPTRLDSRDAHGRRRREFEYVRRGTASWYGIQDASTGAVQMMRSTGSMDSAAFIDPSPSPGSEPGNELPTKITSAAAAGPRRAPSPRCGRSRRRVSVHRRGGGRGFGGEGRSAHVVSKQFVDAH